MRTLFHITTRAAWEAGSAKGIYFADGFSTEGFNHFSRPHQVLKVAEQRFKGSQGLVLLVVDQERLIPEVKYEGADRDFFPHVYGGVNSDAVLEVCDFSDVDERFALPNGYELVGETLIRRGVVGDEAEIASVHTHAWQQSYQGIIPDDVLKSRPLSFRSRLKMWKSILGMKNSEAVFVAESKDHGVVAFCSVGPGRGAEFAGHGEVMAIYCLNEFKKKGIGAALFMSGLKSLGSQGFRKAYLWVLKDNPTKDFYRKAGGKELAMTKEVDLGASVTEVAFEFVLS